MRSELQVGDLAPDFTASAMAGPDASRAWEFALRTVRGERVVLCFYPADDVPGAVGELCGLRDRWEQLRPRALILCISADEPANLRGLIDHYALPFILLSDPGHAVAKAYGLWLGDGGGGDVEGGSPTERATFVIGTDGRVEGILRDSPAAAHAGLLLELLAR